MKNTTGLCSSCLSRLILSCSPCSMSWSADPQGVYHRVSLATAFQLTLARDKHQQEIRSQKQDSIRVFLSRTLSLCVSLAATVASIRFHWVQVALFLPLLFRPKGSNSFPLLLVSGCLNKSSVPLACSHLRQQSLTKLSSPETSVVNSISYQNTD